MRVEVTRPFQWAGEDGNTVRTVPAGSVLEGKGARAALAQGAGVDLDAPPEEKAMDGAPTTAAVSKAPRNKAR